MKKEKRDYYISKELIENLTNDLGRIECCIRTKDSCDISELIVGIDQTNSEVGRHDLAILYKTVTITGQNFQVNFDFVDYGAGGLDYGEGSKLSQIDRLELLNKNGVLIYDSSEENDTDTIFFKVEVLADDIGELSEIGNIVSKLNTEDINNKLKDGTFIILPITKGNSVHDGIIWSKSSDDIFNFHSKYLPTLYTNVSHILNAKVTVPKDFLLYDFFIMNKKVELDTMKNEWISLSYNCCLSVLDLLELDNTGKTHMYVLDNFKDIDKHTIYESFMNLNKNDIVFDTILRVIEKVQPKSTKWVEDYIVENIKSRQDYYFSNYIDIIVKYVRVSKKSEDRDVERFLDMMLNYSIHPHIDGYVRILKALKLKDSELVEYVKRIINKDIQSNMAGSYATSFINNWKTESFKELEDYLYQGIKTQEIHEPYSSSFIHNRTTEEKQRRGLNTDYDFVSNYLSLLRVKGVNKISLSKRYIQGITEDPERFPVARLLAKLEEYINNEEREDLSEIITLFVQYIVLYDTYGEYAKIYIPKEKQKSLGMSYSSYTRYTDAFEPYIDILSDIFLKGKKKKEEEEWAERMRKFDVDFAKRFKK